MCESDPGVSKGTILVVDDTPTNLRILSGILTECGYKVRSAPSGEMALKSIEAGDPPDLILLDVMMPHMNGYEVCQRLKIDKRTSQIPVIFISALGETMDKLLGFSVGGVDYISKPFQMEEVLARVNAHLSLHRLQQELQEQNEWLKVEGIRRDRVMEALKDSRERYRLLAEYSTDMISRQNPQGIYLYVSPACRTLLGYEIEEMVSRAALDFIHPDDAPALVALYAHLAECPPVSTVTYRARRKDGTYLWLETTNKIIHAPNHKIVDEIIAVSRDVTERQQATETLQSLNRRMRDELDLAREIQRSLLPPPQPCWDNLNVICYSQPAYEVGGDFYRYHAFNPARFALAVGDVSGKGVSAALLMASSASIFDTILNRSLSPQERMLRLDKAISPYTRPRRQNCAMCYVELVAEVDDSFTATILNAGCIPPYIRRAGGEVLWPDVGGFALGQGLGQEEGYQEVTLRLWPGDLLILTSDGAPEATNAAHEILGFDRLQQMIAAGPTASPQAMLDHLQREIAAFVGEAEPHDDLTIVIAQV
jgi:PAS domain S-box-containing protein